MVEYYGVPTPLVQLAGITIPEPRVLVITPYDKTSLNDIEHAILASDLGLTPANDGNVIRLVIPQLTGERRQEIAKEVGKLAEEAKIAVRNVRQEAMKTKNGAWKRKSRSLLTNQPRRLTRWLTTSARKSLRVNYG